MKEEGAGEALVSGVAETGGGLSAAAEAEAEGRGDAGGERATKGKRVSRLLAGTAGSGSVDTSTSMLASCCGIIEPAASSASRRWSS